MHMSKFVFRIGPLQFSEELKYFYYVYPWQDDNSFFIAGSNEEGLNKILEIHNSNEIECESELEEICTRYGIPVGEITPERGYNILLMGLEAIEEQHFKDISRGGLVYQFGGAAADFWYSQPWNKAFAKLRLQFEFTGSVNSVRYGLVMGGGNQEYGIALYKTREDLKTILELARNEFLEEAAAFETMGVILKDEPSYAAHAIQRACGINKIPIPVLVQNAKRCFVTDLDILMLSTALEAISTMDDDIQFAIGRVSVGDLVEVCRVTPMMD
jgi:hypothetical protein